MKLPELVLRPDPRLTQPSARVHDFGTELSRLVTTMGRVVERSNGVGLAAVQIGVPLCVFVMVQSDELHSFANPEVVSYGSWYTATEGCLSIPGETLYPPRPRSLVLTWQDLHGERHLREFDSFPAHVISHEMDHLSGILAPARSAIGPALSV